MPKNESQLHRDDNRTPLHDGNKRWSGGTKLTASVILLAIIWLGILPLFSRLPNVQEKLDTYQRAGIDPYAVFYSDHPGMRDVERRVDSIVNGHDDSFWTLPKK